MNIDVQIDKDKINDLLVQKILESAIGEEIEKCVKKYIKELDKGYMRDNAIMNIVKCEVNGIIIDVVRTEYVESIKSVVREKMLDEVVSGIIDTAIGNLYK